MDLSTNADKGSRRKTRANSSARDSITTIIPIVARFTTATHVALISKLSTEVFRPSRMSMMSVTFAWTHSSRPDSHCNLDSVTFASASSLGQCDVLTVTTAYDAPAIKLLDNVFKCSGGLNRSLHLKSHVHIMRTGLVYVGTLSSGQ